jgi:NADH pyrophosphatase-like rudimentary NUDIX domain
LGVDEAHTPPVVDAPGREIAEKYPGEAYFSIDVTSENQSEKYKKGAEDIIERAKAKGLDFLTVRIGVSLSDTEAPIVAMARSFTDWNLRNVVIISL